MPQGRKGSLPPPFIPPAQLMSLLLAAKSGQPLPALGRKADPADGGHRRALLACTTCNQFTALWK